MIGARISRKLLSVTFVSAFSFQSWPFTSSVTQFIYSVFRLYWYWAVWLDKCQWAKSCFTFVAELKSTTQAQQPLFATITPLPRVKIRFTWLDCCINYLYILRFLYIIVNAGKNNLTDATLVWKQDVCMDRIGSFVVSASITAIITQYISKQIKLPSFHCQFLSIELTVGYFIGVWGFLQVTQFVATI